MNELMASNENGVGYDLIVQSDENGISSRQEPCVANIRFERLDSLHHALHYKLDDATFIRMEESNQANVRSDFMDAEFDESVEPALWPYYSIAAASGTLTGMLSIIDWANVDLGKINQWKNKDWDKYLIVIAKGLGCKKSTKKDAIHFIMDRAVSFSYDHLNESMKAKLDHFMSNLAMHPTECGILFSIFSQFSGKSYSIDDGKFQIGDLPDYYFIGNDPAEKIIVGFLYWMFYLLVDEDISKSRIIDQLPIPKQLVRVIKDLVGKKLVEGKSVECHALEKKYSSWLKKLFQTSEFSSEAMNNTRKAIDSLKGLINQSFPVLLNECVFRSFYILKTLVTEIREKDIHSIDDLDRVDKDKLLPVDNRIISRMGLIASTSFVVVNLSGAVIRSYAKNGENGAQAVALGLISEVNIAGVGRFIFACAQDCKYWACDISILYEKIRNREQTNNVVDEDAFDEDVFDSMRLDSLQTQILYSLESLAVAHDISRTKKKEQREIKEKWFEKWQEQLLYGLGIDSDDYFVTDEEILYQALYDFSKEAENRRWLYLLAMELALFKPYHANVIRFDSLLTKPKYEYDYVADRFIRKQTVVTQDELDGMIKDFQKYSDIVSGKRTGFFVAAGVVTAATVLSGGIALAAAPEIAVALAGEAVIGLHGAALTSASLAFVGGGSLAAGGLGMAGGTAIIAGGGALVGLAGSGSLSVASVLLQTSPEYWIKQGAKLLTFCKDILVGQFKDTAAVNSIHKYLEQLLKDLDDELSDMKAEKDFLEVENMNRMKAYIKCIKKTSAEIKKLI